MASCCLLQPRNLPCIPSRRRYTFLFLYSERSCSARGRGHGFCGLCHERSKLQPYHLCLHLHYAEAKPGTGNHHHQEPLEGGTASSGYGLLNCKFISKMHFPANLVCSFCRTRTFTEAGIFSSTRNLSLSLSLAGVLYGGTWWPRNRRYSSTELLSIIPPRDFSET